MNLKRAGHTFREVILLDGRREEWSQTNPNGRGRDWSYFQSRPFNANGSASAEQRLPGVRVVVPRVAYGNRHKVPIAESGPAQAICRLAPRGIHFLAKDLGVGR